MVSVELKAFPKAMKNELNRIAAKSQSSDKIEGYVYDGADGSQMAFWECKAGGVSPAHTHDYDEYMTVVQGRYTVIINSDRFDIENGKDILIPKGTPHAGEYVQGTRTIHWFGGKRAGRKK